MTANEEVIIIANKLANEGKKPSIALIKTKLVSSIPLPIIISALKVWQHDPEYTSSRLERPLVESTLKNATDVDEIYVVIQEAIAPLKAEIQQLKIEIAELKKG